MSDADLHAPYSTPMDSRSSAAETATSQWPPAADQSAPILEHDPATEAIIEPTGKHSAPTLPERCVLCFFHEAIASLVADGTAKQATELRSEMGPLPVYQFAESGRALTLAHPGLGAPMGAAFMEELIALGCRHFVACGGAGVLRGDIAVGHLVVPTAAVREEGTSYHYFPPSRELTPSPAAVTAIRSVLDEAGIAYLAGKTWTTDGLYRETPDKVARRRAEGCLTVEMECSALCAVARFRGVTFGQILYGGDDVSGIEWDRRGWDGHAVVRARLLHLAAQACLRIP